MGEPDTPTSAAVRAAAAVRLNSPGGEGYAAALGEPALREAIVGALGADPSRAGVVVTPGAQTALYMALRLALRGRPGDEVRRFRVLAFS